MTPRRRFKLRSESKDEEDFSDISDISCPDPPELQPSKSNRPKKKRHKFTHSEDKKMLNYIMEENRYNEIKGLAIWKDMEILQITNHTKQSMKYRFLKTVIPNLHQYDVPKSWVVKLSRMFPEMMEKNPDKENARGDSSLCSMFEKWRKQSPGLRSSPRLPANNATKTAEESGESEEDETNTSSEACNISTSEKRKRHNPGLRSSPQLTANKAKKTVIESDVSEEEGKSTNNDGCNSETTLPYTESPYFSHRRKKQKYESLRFNSSSESEAEEEEEERNGSANDATADSSVSLDPSPSKSTEAVSKEDSSSGQSELSDYDQYLMNIAKKTSPSKNSSRSDEDDAQSDKANTTNEDFAPDPEEEMDPDDSTCVVEDRRSRLQRRRHIKKVQKAYGGESSSSTSPQKKSKKTNLAEFVTNSNPEETLNENKDDSSPEKPNEELTECKTIISDIAQSYGLTNREVLSTIFSFNGSIEKTISYIRLGPELSELKPWSEEEDQIISSTDESSIKMVAKKRGNKFIAERLQFLENFTEDVMS